MDKMLSSQLVSEASSIAFSLAILGLSLSGIAGAAYHVLAPEGILSQRILSLWGRHPLFATLVMIGVVAMLLAARAGELGRRIGRSTTDAPLYLFVALGMLFAGRLVVFGTF